VTPRHLRLGPRRRLPIRRGVAADLLILAVVSAVPHPAGAQAPDPLVLEGEVPPGDETHFFLPFDVPVGIVEVEVRHTDLSDENILDWGLDDPNGHRGWGGGLTAPSVVGVDAASRGYAPGPIPEGSWRVVVGKARIDDPPGRYRVEVILRDADPTLDAQPERAPYAPVPALEEGPRWYAGDFHVHSRESGDALADEATLDAIATLAEERGLDFVVITDHNVHTAPSFFADVQARHPDVLLVPGVEHTTYAGHGNGIGVTGWQDHRIGVAGATIADAIGGYRAEGGLFSINHPVLDVSCIGCAWQHEVDPATIDGVEVQGTAVPLVQGLFYDRAIGFWEDLLDRGGRAAALGGSDDHRAGVDLSELQSPVGDPTTLVWADELSVAGIVAGVRGGRTVVKLSGPDAPMIDVSSSVPRAPDAPVAVGPTELTYEVTGADAVGGSLRIIRDGELVAEVPVDAVPFAHRVTARASGGRARRYRADLVVDRRELVMTSYTWVEAGEDGGGGGGCRLGAGPLPGAAGAFGPIAALLALIGWRRGTRRRGSPG